MVEDFGKIRFRRSWIHECICFESTGPKLKRKKKQAQQRHTHKDGKIDNEHDRDDKQTKSTEQEAELSKKIISNRKNFTKFRFRIFDISRIKFTLKTYNFVPILTFNSI